MEGLAHAGRLVQRRPRIIGLVVVEPQPPAIEVEVSWAASPSRMTSRASREDGALHPGVVRPLSGSVR